MHKEFHHLKYPILNVTNSIDSFSNDLTIFCREGSGLDSEKILLGLSSSHLRAHSLFSSSSSSVIISWEVCCSPKSLLSSSNCLHSFSFHFISLNFVCRTSSHVIDMESVFSLKRITQLFLCFTLLNLLFFYSNQILSIFHNSVCFFNVCFNYHFITFKKRGFASISS